jgi:alpha-galactosidase/6-phospho-beta-glucosidase family protein
MKIAYIGGGSRSWARELIMDLALCADLDGEAFLYDIDLEAAQLNERLGNFIQAQPGATTRWTYRAVETLPEALQGASFVVISIQPGTLECMQAEIAIAAHYGLHFPVGDTTGAPGLVRGLRSALIYEGFAHAIAEHCPQAWVINYTNPLTICTRTLTRVEPGLKAFGCCHEVFGAQAILAEVVGECLPGERPERQEIEVNVLGINHFTFIDKASYQGRDVLALLRGYIQRPGVLRTFTRQEVEDAGSYLFDGRQVKFGAFQRFGILPAAGDRHLVEFFPGYVNSLETLFRSGLICTPVSFRIQSWKDALTQVQALLAGKDDLVLHPSGEEGVAQMRALLGLGNLITNVNVENRGQVSNLPLGAVVETNARFSRDEVRPLLAGALPPSVQALVARHAANQELIIEAALRRDVDLAFQAVYNDPNNILPIDRAWTMFSEMLQATREFLPGLNLE